MVQKDAKADAEKHRYTGENVKKYTIDKYHHCTRKRGERLHRYTFYSHDAGFPKKRACISAHRHIRFLKKQKMRSIDVMALI